jgi:AraC family transcriptional regulator
MSTRQTSGMPLAGKVVKSKTIKTFELVERSLPAGLALQSHTHGFAFITYMVRGEFKETIGSKTSECKQGSLRFLPSEEAHSNQIQQSASCLQIQIPNGTLKRAMDSGLRTDVGGEITSPVAAVLGARVYFEFSNADSFTPLSLECLILDALAQHSKFSTNARRYVPSWLKRVRECLESIEAIDFSLDQIAAIAGVHPVHLCREFHRYYGCTTGEFTRQIRVRHACDLLQRSEQTLAEVALESGFSDQSHLCTIFRRYFGTSPAKYRRTVRGPYLSSAH